MLANILSEFSGRKVENIVDSWRFSFRIESNAKFNPHIPQRRTTLSISGFSLYKQPPFGSNRGGSSFYFGPCS